MSQIPKIILASSSPRRAELLQQIDVEFEVKSADIDETVLEGESAIEMVKRLSYLKAKKVSELYPNRLILAADTTVALGSAILGKPEDTNDAFLMLQKLSGNIHDVFTSFTFINLEQNIQITELDHTKVEFYPISDTRIKEYVETGEPMDKAGSYGLQGKSAKFIKEISGNYTNVLGLNVAKVFKILNELYDQR